MNGKPLLEVQGLVTEFATFDGVRRPVDGVDFVIQEGETVGLVGETGAGKTVLARSLIKHIKPPGQIVAGTVLYGGRDILQEDDRGIRAIRGKEIAWVGSNPRGALNPVQRVGDQLADVVQSHSSVKRSDAIARALGLMRMVGIPDPLRRMRAYPHELSGGMAQRVVIAMALANEPRLLMADEPTFGLDVTIQIQILDLIKDLVKRTSAAALLVTRDLAVVAHYCDTVFVMQKGKIVEKAPVREFFSGAQHPHSLALLKAAFAARGEEVA
ncbi:MAG: ABC transporter ATP-binding protein [Dehalococcoidia bacterium]